MMRKLFIGTVTLLTVGAILAGSATAQETLASGSQPAPTAKTQQAPAAGQNPRVQALTTQKDKVSYAVGLSIGKNLQRDSVEVDPNIVLQGLTDGLTGGKVLLTDDEVKATLTTLQSEVRQRQQAKMQEAAATNKKEGAAFLAANKTKQGVVTLPSGLQYKVITAGTGPKPTAADTVLCNYKGTLLDGTEFDSSMKRGQPASIPVGRVIRGWTEALQLMPVGSKWELYIPPSLAYGEQGTNGGPIGPDATLVFEVELLSIQPKPEPKPAPPAMTSPDGQTKTPAVPQPQPATPAPSAHAPAQKPPETPPPAKP